MIDLDKAYEFFRSIGEKDAGRDFSLECALIEELKAANAKIERYESELRFIAMPSDCGPIACQMRIKRAREALEDTKEKGCKSKFHGTPNHVCVHNRELIQDANEEK